MKGKICILGAAGFIGASLRAYFNNLGVEVLAPTRSEFDLLITENQFNFENCHLIYAAGIPRSKQNDQEALDQNLLMISNVLEKSKGILSFTFLSSVEIYGDKNKFKIIEETKANPLNLYAKGKVLAEEKLTKYFKDSIPVNILRLPGVYGVSGKLGLLGSINLSIENNTCFKVLNHGNDQRDFLFADDLGAVIEKLILKEKSHTLNVATGTSLRVREICELIQKTNPNFQYSLEEAGSGHFDLSFDVTKLKQVIDELKLTKIEEGIKKTFFL
ncbi:hypothetical protein A9Q84_19310 [Halobacteriovorax marinus]|uniref:NAD-dependent epimerase/dehydratase domain-containing protein n=1 Tax=Halobacteriovorax marinus TaxID=97084 RepID=A0A1Y5F6D8_9BACT|nr:hypothetical protein A9Q84_19310 [Halobacteriovorax marinus]